MGQSIWEDAVASVKRTCCALGASRSPWHKASPPPPPKEQPTYTFA